jgi:NAD(P)-dependent dehydrogenase (short-subunit alcohol dehydrogenase family)
MAAAKRAGEQRVAIVTGGASGIGLATVKRLVSDGLRVVICDLNEAGANDARRSILDENPRAELLVQPCDVSKEPEVQRTVAATLEAFGSFDVMVNNAGMMIFKPLEQHTTEDWMKVLSVDLMGAFYFIKQAFSKMSRGGAVVNVSSVHAVETTPLVAAYAAAKAALLSLTRTAAIEGKPKGIRVNALLPGAVDTPMLWSNPNVKSGVEVIDQADVGKPEDIAAAIAFLASRDAAFVQGAAVNVDGGRLSEL